MQTLQNSFGSGELSPAMGALIQTDQYTRGCRKLRNAMLGKFGSARKRPGFQYVGDATRTTSARFIPLRLRDTGEFMLEFSHQKIDFWQGGAYDVSITSVTTPYAEAELDEIQYAQFGEELHLVHPTYEPRVLVERAGQFYLDVINTSYTGPKLDPKTKSVPMSYTEGSSKKFLETTEEEADTFSELDFYDRSDPAVPTGGPIYRVHQYWFKAFEGANFSVSPQKMRVDVLGNVVAGSLNDLADVGPSSNWAGPWVGQTKVNEGTERMVGDASSMTGYTTLNEGDSLEIDCTFDGQFTTGGSTNHHWRVGQLLSLWGGTVGNTEGALIVQVVRIANDRAYLTCIHNNMTSGQNTTLIGGGNFDNWQFYELRDKHTGERGIVMQADGASGSSIQLTVGPIGFSQDMPDVFRSGACVGGLIYMNGGTYEITSHGGTGWEVVVTAVEDNEPAHPFSTTEWSLGWSSDTGYPRTVAVHQRRLWFGGVDRFPQRTYASRVEKPNDFTNGPLDDDALTLSLSAETGGGIQWMRSARTLLAGSEDQEFSIQGEPISVSDIGVDSESTFGGRSRQAVMVSNATLFISRNGRGIRAMQYNFDTDGYASPDITDMSSHLFDNTRVRQLAYMSDPDSVLFALLEDGNIAAYTSRPENAVTGWSLWDMGSDTVKSVAVRRPEGDGDDELWIIIDRGGTRYVEKLRVDSYSDHELSWSQSASTTVTHADLSNLDGRTVECIGDGLRLGTFQVASGAITVPVAVSEVVVGLPIDFVFRPQRLEGRDSYGDTPGRVRTLHKVRVLLERSVGGYVNGYEIMDHTETNQLVYRPIQPDVVTSGTVYSPGLDTDYTPSGEDVYAYHLETTSSVSAPNLTTTRSRWYEVVIDVSDEYGAADVEITHSTAQRFEVVAVSTEIRYEGS